MGLAGLLTSTISMPAVPGTYARVWLPLAYTATASSVPLLAGTWPSSESRLPPCEPLLIESVLVTVPMPTGSVLGLTVRLPVTGKPISMLPWPVPPGIG